MMMCSCLLINIRVIIKTTTVKYDYATTKSRTLYKIYTKANGSETVKQNYVTKPAIKCQYTNKNNGNHS